MTTKRKAIGYIRVSTERQVQDGCSLDAQRVKLEAYCQQNGYDLFQVFKDEGISAKRTDNRKGVQDAIRTACQEGATLIVYSLSRLSRSVLDACTIAETLRKSGANLASCTESFDTTSPSGNMIFQVLSSVAELERKMIGERVKSSLDLKKSKGEKLGGTCPFGFRVKGSKLIQDQTEQDAISRMRTLRAEGLSLRKIGKRLTDEGINPKSSKVWSAKVIRSLLNR